MSNGKHGHDSYQKDVFDNPPAGPVGVHRGAKPLAPKVTFFAVILVLAVALGILFWGIFSGEMANIWDGNNKPETSQSAEIQQEAKAEKKEQEDEAKTEKTPASESASPSTDNKSEESKSPEPEESQGVNKGLGIAVVNGTGVTGYATERAGTLTASGFTNVAPQNPDGLGLPGQSVVWYQNDDDHATAQEVASSLGIAIVEKHDGLGTPIVAILME